jgi:hypothetical protein
MTSARADPALVPESQAGHAGPSRSGEGPDGHLGFVHGRCRMPGRLPDGASIAAARAKLLPDPARMRASSHPALSGLASPRETHVRTPTGGGASIATRSPFFIFRGDYTSGSGMGGYDRQYSCPYFGEALDPVGE